MKVSVVLAMLFLASGCASPSTSTSTNTTTNSNSNPGSDPSSNASAAPRATTVEEQTARLAQFWTGLLSDNLDDQQTAIDMLRDDPEIAGYSIHARPEWSPENRLGLVLDARTIHCDASKIKLSVTLWRQNFSALAAGSAPFADWPPAARARTLLAVYECTVNMRRFVRLLDVAAIPPRPAPSLMPEKLEFFGMQFDACTRTSFIRAEVLRAVEQSPLPGFGAEALQQRQQELKEDRKRDGELFRKWQQQWDRFGKDVKRLEEKVNGP